MGTWLSVAESMVGIVAAVVTAAATVTMARYAATLNTFSGQQANRASEAEERRLSGVRKAAQYRLIVAETMCRGAEGNPKALLLMAQREVAFPLPDPEALFSALDEEAADAVMLAFLSIDELLQTIRSVSRTLERSYWLTTFFVPVPQNRQMLSEIRKLSQQTLPIIVQAREKAGFRNPSQAARTE